MEPVSVIGLASSIITFIDFASKLISGATEYYHAADGTPQENARLQDVVDDLDSIINELSRQYFPAAQTDRDVQHLARDCLDDCENLSKLLGRLRISPGARRKPWKHFKASWDNLRTKGEISELRDRLQEYRSEILLNISLMAKNEQSDLGSQINSIRTDCKDFKIEFPSRLDSLRDELQRSVESESQQIKHSLADVACQLQELSLLVNVTIPIQHRILRALVYDDMYSREQQIYTGGDATCDWILGVQRSAYTDDASRRATSRNFLDWLRCGSNVLHISGKAGAGKSTLMKFITRHEKTRFELEKWAEPKTLVTASFYFWNPGNRMQMTLPGLYRSLLFEILSHSPEITREVFPSQWEQLRKNSLDVEIQRLQLFKDEHIEEAFKVLITKQRHLHHRFCFFIDGLDEYQGNRLDHENIAQMLKGWTEGGDVKICTSSRPHREFLCLFTYPKNPTVESHQCNQLDIYRYALDRFQRDRETQTISNFSSDFAYRVAEGAQGVFLWAHLVVDIILQGIRQGDSHSVLEQKLREVPAELDDLYENLRKPIKSELDKKRSNVMLLLAVENPFEWDLSAMTFSWLDGDYGLESSDFPRIADATAYSILEFEDRPKVVEKQIDGLTRGFLELWHEPQNSRERNLVKPSTYGVRIKFAHRTARDYFLTQNRLSQLRSAFERFDKDNMYARICLSELLFESYATYHMGCLGTWLSHMTTYVKGLDGVVIGQFKAAIMERSPKKIFSPNHHTNGEDEHALPTFSYIHYAAFHGLADFVREELITQPALARTSNGKSILFNILVGSLRLKLGLLNCLLLAEELIVRGDSLDDSCLVRDCERSFRCPEWVLSASYMLTNWVRYSNSGIPQVTRLAVSSLRRLLLHGQRSGHAYVVHWALSDFPTDQNGTFQISDLVRICETWMTQCESPRSKLDSTDSKTMVESVTSECFGYPTHQCNTGFRQRRALIYQWNDLQFDLNNI